MKIFASAMHISVLSFSYKKLSLADIGRLYLDTTSPEYKPILEKIKSFFCATEIIHISTCNRCEFYLVSPETINKESLKEFFHLIYPHFSEQEIEKYCIKASLKKDKKAVQYLMELSSSLQSMVVGEREIITQLRTAYDISRTAELSGDILRLLFKKVIETGKQVFTETEISKNPVSVASLAARQVNQDIDLSTKTNITVVGSGVTIQTFLKYFAKENFAWTFISRKKDNAAILQNKYGGLAFDLNELKQKDFIKTDILVVCTASPAPIINSEVFQKLFKDNHYPIIIDLANPSDVDKEIFKTKALYYLSIKDLKMQAKENLGKRKQAIIHAKQIINKNLNEFAFMLKERSVETFIAEIPKEFSEYKNRALTEIFNKQIETLEDEQKQLVSDIVNYIEGKYNAVTFKKLKHLLIQSKD